MVESKKLETELFLPMVDNDVFTQTLDILMAQNKFKQCNIITGYNSDESAVFLVDTYEVLGDDPKKYSNKAKNFDYQAFVKGMRKLFVYWPVFPYYASEHLLSRIIDRYYLPIAPGQKSINFLGLLSKLFSDYQYVCQAYQIADAYAQKQNQVYVYEFRYKLRNSGIPDDLKKYFGVTTHSDELSITFGNIVT